MRGISSRSSGQAHRWRATAEARANRNNCCRHSGRRPGSRALPGQAARRSGTCRSCSAGAAINMDRLAPSMALALRAAFGVRVCSCKPSRVPPRQSRGGPGMTKPCCDQDSFQNWYLAWKNTSRPVSGRARITPPIPVFLPVKRALPSVRPIALVRLVPCRRNCQFGP